MDRGDTGSLDGTSQLTCFMQGLCLKRGGKARSGTRRLSSVCLSHVPWPILGHTPPHVVNKYPLPDAYMHSQTQICFLLCFLKVSGAVHMSDHPTEQSARHTGSFVPS